MKLARETADLIKMMGSDVCAQFYCSTCLIFSSVVCIDVVKFPRLTDHGSNFGGLAQPFCNLDN
jgi:hypothetical protein